MRRLQERDLGVERLAAPLAAGVESRIRDAVNTFMSSPEGTRLLLNVIELTHERTVYLLRDELDKLPNIAVAEGEVRLNLVPLMAEVLRRTINAGLDIAGIDNREIPEFTSAEDADRVASEIGGPWMREHIIPLLARGPERSVGQVIASATATG